MPLLVDQTTSEFACPVCGVALQRVTRSVRGWMGEERPAQVSFVCTTDAAHIPAGYEPGADAPEPAHRLPPLTDPWADGEAPTDFRPDFP